MVFSRAFCFDLIIKGDKAARDACAKISPFFGLVGRTVLRSLKRKNEING